MKSSMHIHRNKFKIVTPCKIAGCVTNKTKQNKIIYHIKHSKQLKTNVQDLRIAIILVYNFHRPLWLISHQSYLPRWLGRYGTDLKRLRRHNRDNYSPLPPGSVTNEYWFVPIRGSIARRPPVTSMFPSRVVPVPGLLPIRLGNYVYLQIPQIQDRGPKITIIYDCEYK